MKQRTRFGSIRPYCGLFFAATAALGLIAPPPTRATSPPRMTINSCDTPSAIVTIEEQVNVFTSSEQDNATIDMSPDGRTVIAWESKRQEAGTYGIYARALDALGRPLTHEVHVNQYVRSQQRLPGVAFAGGETVWFVWDSYGQDGQAGSIVARRFHTDLRPEGPEIPVNTTREGDQTNPVIIGRSNGSALIAWTSAIPGVGRRSDIRARLFDPKDRPITGEVEVSEDNDALDVLPAIAALPDGRAIVVWARSRSRESIDGIYGRCITEQGLPEGDEFLVSPEDGNQHIEPSVSSAADGRFVVAWMSGSDNGYAVMMRRFDPDGSPLGNAEVVTTPESGWKSGVCVAMAPDGRFVVSYNSDGEDGSGDGIFACEYDADGSHPTLSRVNKRVEGRQELTIANGARRVAWSPRGQLAHAWNGDSGTGDRSAVNVTLRVPSGLRVPDPPDLGEPEAAARVTSDEFLAANPPIWDPYYEPIEPLPLGTGAGGDFGFEAVTYTGWTPPDPEMAVGPSDIVVITNGEIHTFTKTGVSRWWDEIENSYGFWGELGADNFVFDPEVQWDPHARRFFAMAAERSDNNRSNFLLAVSRDESPDDRDDWYKYRLDVTDLAGNDIDSPNVAMNTNYVLLTADFFGPDKYLIYIIDKGSILNGGTPVTTSELITGSQSMGIPVVYDADDHLYILQSTEFTNNTEVIFHAISNPFTAYSRQTYTLTVPAYQYPTPPPQRGSSSRPELFEPRFWSVAERNGSIWAVHHVNSTRTRVRWYEFALNGWPTAGTPSIAQWGEIDLGEGIHTYFPSIHVDAANNAAITFARSASNEYISIGRAVRAADDPPNKFRPVQVVQTSQNPHNSGRWGDYSGTQADNETPDTFWGHHEFTNGSMYSWRTWVARYDLHSEPMVLTVPPLYAGSTADITVTGATPGTPVFFAFSLDGTGITEVAPLNATLSLENPIRGPSAIADGSGTATISQAIPPGAAGVDVWIQAIENSRTTNWVKSTIQ